MHVFFLVLLFISFRFSYFAAPDFQQDLALSSLLPFSFLLVFFMKKDKLKSIISYLNFAFIGIISILNIYLSNDLAFISSASEKLLDNAPFFHPISELYFVLFFLFLFIFLFASVFRACKIYLSKKKNINNDNLSKFIWTRSIYILAFIFANASFLFYYEPVGFIELASLLFIFLMLFEAYRLAFFDELTGLLNRRAYERQLLENEDTLAILDIDFFKKCNDVHGHDFGDYVLQQVSLFMRKNAKGAKAFRLGGEEFVMLYKNKNINEAAKLANALREGIKDMPLQFKNINSNITVSIGLAEFNGNKTSTLKAADKKLYEAKENGRDQVRY